VVKKIFISGLILVGVLILIFFGYSLGQKRVVLQNQDNVRGSIVPKQNAQDLALLNPSVSSKNNRHFIINFQDLRRQYDAIQKKYEQKTYVYFTYLNNGAWVGLSEREFFTAASTVKVPLAMSILKAVEDELIGLDQQYTLEELDLDKGFGNLYKVGDGQTFSLRELMRYMLEKSDNTSANAVAESLKRIGIADPLEKVYGYMGWQGANLGEVPSYNQITVKLLSNMFLALYNADYISPEHSELVLQHLTKTAFNEQIRSGVPLNVSIAHKIGVSDNNETFSDCGIIYAPSRPYILCLASNGADEAVANKFMKEVSEVTYKYVISN